MGTLRLGLLGNPVAHSRSPEIQHAMLEMAGLEGSYATILADEDVFDSTVSDLRQSVWHGLNVTMPHKARAAATCDEVSSAARLSGSVNTLFMHEGSLHGESTDTTAMKAVMEDGRFEAGLPVLVLGAGGGAAAAIAGIESRQVYVSARRPDAAASLAGRLDGQVVAWGTPVVNAIVINSTPIGMRGELLPEAVLEACRGLIDLAYSKIETPAIVEARQRGIALADGYEFLVRQAIDSFAIWTGQRIDYASLRERLRKT